ncbi:MAG TPA: endonuclease/exonuclease/phosphatase family protein [Pseudonocardia sp.]
MTTEPTDAAPPGPGGVRVATFNLLSGRDVRFGARFDLDAAAAAIDALDADVVAVQEVDRELDRSGRVHQVQELAALLDRTGVFAPALLGDPTLRWTRGPGADPDPGGPAYGIGVLSRLPVTAVAVCPLPGGGPGQARPRRPDARHPPIPYRDGEPRAALRVTVAAPWGPVAVTTAHLSFVPWRGRRQLATAAAFACGGAARAAVLLGDLNLPPNVVGRTLGRRGWRTGPTGPTFPSWRPALQLDHLLVRGDADLDDLHVGPPGPSDHLPLVGTVRPRTPGARAPAPRAGTDREADRERAQPRRTPGPTR